MDPGLRRDLNTTGLLLTWHGVSRQRPDFSGSTQRIAGGEPEPRRGRLGVAAGGGSGLFARGTADAAGGSDVLVPLPYGGPTKAPGITSPGSRSHERDREWRPWPRCR